MQLLHIRCTLGSLQILQGTLEWEVWLRVEQSLHGHGGTCARPTASLTVWDNLLAQIFIYVFKKKNPDHISIKLHV